LDVRGRLKSLRLPVGLDGAVTDAAGWWPEDEFCFAIDSVAEIEAEDGSDSITVCHTSVAAGSPRGVRTQLRDLETGAGGVVRSLGRGGEEDRAQP
jgi:hypothetical protein